LEYWLWLAKLAEKGKITSIFIADSYAGHNIYGGSANASYKVRLRMIHGKRLLLTRLGSSHIGKLDPLMTISAMATVTESVSFGITASTSYIRELTQTQ
jgi:alkanesulfonate monooxygenase SsuD/methylene tetrahydromethanopterin reductase-like flavin-dependent oxidoreductase (luciferase family)